MRRWITMSPTTTVPSASSEEYSYMFAHGTRWAARPRATTLPRCSTAPTPASPVARRPTRSPAVVLVGTPATETRVNASRKKYATIAAM
jgi:hypothetical protein